MQLDVFFYEAFEEEAAEIKKHLPPGLKAAFTAATIQEQHDPAPPARLISIRTQSVIPPDWAGRLAGVVTRSTGYDHLSAYRNMNRPDLPCGYLPEYCARAVAEQAILMAMALLRKLPAQARQFNDFNRDGLTGREVRGKTLLVVGVGNIGGEVGNIGGALGMRVLGVDIVRRRDNLLYVSIEEGLPEADVVVCAMNLTADNRGYFSRARWQRIKSGAVFVNIARGEMSPVSDLIQALDEGLLAGVALDVYDEESRLAVALRSGVTEDKALRDIQDLSTRPNVLLPPHNAFNTHESVERKSRQTVEQVRHFLDQGRFLWPLPE